MSQRPRIYLDHAATTPILPAAKAAMVAAMDRWANPSSPHAEGRAARAALEDARERIKRALGWEGELIFTSGATEAIEIALGRTDRRVLVSAVEHDAVFRAAPNAEVLPIGEDQQVDQQALAVALKNGAPPVVAIQHLNSEVGIAQAVSDLTGVVRASGGLLLSDCSQSAGKVPLPDADLIVVSAHKLGGPAGIGALLVRDFKMLRATGGQEFGYRGGTQNVPGTVGFAAALEAADIGFHDDPIFGDRPMADWLAGLAHIISEITFPRDPVLEVGKVFGTGEWPILAMTMPGVPSQVQLIRFDAEGFAVSAGSACSSGSLKPSRALAAFGVSAEDAACTIRVSFGWPTTVWEIQAFFETWEKIAGDARKRAA